MKISGIFLALLVCLFLCACQSDNGFVRVSKTNSNYMEISGEGAYIPIGYNLAFPRYWDKMSEDECFRMIEIHLKYISENGGNYTRLWASHPFYEFEDEKAGVYNPKKLARIDRFMSMARKYNVRVKICVEHFRNIKKYKPNENERGLRTDLFARPAYDGEFSNMREYFESQKGRDFYFNRFKVLFEKYGNDPIVFAWELWNEQNTVNARTESVKAWQEYMFDRIGGICKKQLIVNSLGSFDSDYSLERYIAFNRNTKNAIAPVHRYLDEGAKYGVCQAPVDLLAADAIDSIKIISPDKPAFLAETGAVEPKHSGPWRFYDADKDGVIFHDAFYTPFFRGSAGTGQPWHWDLYIFNHELWRHLKSFANLTKGVDPTRENFSPSRADTKKCRVYVLSGNKTILAFVRDKKNDWKSEFLKGKKPKEIKGEFVDFTSFVADSNISKVEIFDLWGGDTTETERSAKVRLPDFKRSIAVRIYLK